jgi:hypothetical protein
MYIDVHATDAPPGVHYSGALRLFRLRCKDLLYAFRVDDQRNLEHLYWGPVLPASDDITYLTGAHVPGPFDPRGTAALADKLGFQEINTIVQSVQSLSESWRVFTREKQASFGNNIEVLFKSRRLENASRRLWHMERNKGGDLNRDLSDGTLQKALEPSANTTGTSSAIHRSSSSTAGIMVSLMMSVLTDTRLYKSPWRYKSPFQLTHTSPEKRSRWVEASVSP